MRSNTPSECGLNGNRGPGYHGGALVKFLKGVVLFCLGGTAYLLVELLWRGHTHWSMGIVGGICFLLMGEINEFFPWDTPLWAQSAIAAGIITIVEFVSGCILNLWLHWNIWDYSGVFGNIMGQVCVPYVAAWFFLSIAGILLDDVCRWKLFGEEKPRYRLFIKKQ
jgi:hypothetical protein